jgi:hypothetical protein
MDRDAIAKPSVVISGGFVKPKGIHKKYIKSNLLLMYFKNSISLNTHGIHSRH